MKFTYSVKVRKDGVARIGRDQVPVDKFMEHMFCRRKVIKRSLDTPCWEWTGAVSKKGFGYGTVMFQGRDWRVNRLAWFLTFGEIPNKMEVCHKCDNTHCFNPGHLFLGTHTDNMRDAASKGRLVNLTGEDHGGSKLTERHVMEIRRRYIPRTDSRHVLAKEFGIYHGTVWQIANRKLWKHVN